MAGALVLRLFFFGVGTELFTFGFFARLLFGAALIYSGVQTFRDTGEESDPKQNRCVRFITRWLPVYDGYAEDGSFFLTRDNWENNTELEFTPTPTVFGDGIISEEWSGGLELEQRTGPESRKPPTPSSFASAGKPGKRTTKVTLLFVVVITLEVIDILFAVDSVTAKISEIKLFDTRINLFLNFTSSMFAIFVLRSLYTFMDHVVRMCRFLQQGVAIVLVFIGTKLIVAQYIDLGMVLSCSLVGGVLALSVLLSAVCPETPKDTTAEEADATGRRLGENESTQLQND